MANLTTSAEVDTRKQAIDTFNKVTLVSGHLSRDFVPCAVVKVKHTCQVRIKLKMREKAFFDTS